MKKEETNFLLGGVSEEDVTAISNFNTEISSINFEYINVDDGLSKVKIKKLSRIEKLQIIKKQNNEIKFRIDESNVLTIYRILKVNPEYIGYKRK